MKLKLFIFFFFSFYFISSAADYFWVGGSGNWSDINHWRTTSGGNSLPSVIPGRNDDVFFDANSGFTTFSKKITIDADVNCRNIKFNGSSVAPILTDDGNSYILNIYGSSEWQLGMPDISISYIYYRNTNSPKTIKSNGVVTGEYYNEIYFEEKSFITLSDSFYNKYNLHITAGTFNTNNHNLKIGNVLYLNDWGDNRTVNLGTSTLTLTDGGAYVFANSNFLTLNASQSNIVFLENGTIQAYLNQVYNNITFNESGTFKGDNTTVKALIFNGDSQVFGNNNFDDLRFLKEGDVYLENGKTQNIKVLLEVNPGDCSGFITLKSDYDGYLTTVNALTGYNPTILVKDVIMQDITATGIANFTANNSTNVSNNSSNWTFVSGAPKNFYWIGGSGNWNNNQHWSLTSGGVFTNCLPTPNDNVFFDQNSGFSVNNNSVRVNVNAFMHNITVSGSSIPPSIKETTSNLNFNIYGSSEWQTGMNPIEVSNIYY